MNQEYKNTLFRIERPPAPLPERFGILTAFNPNGKQVSEEANQKLDSDLAQTLKQRGFFHWRVIGGSQDFKHAEPGFGIEADLGTIILLGRQFQQEAVFWIHHRELYLVPIIHLGLWETRIQGKA